MSRIISSVNIPMLRFLGRKLIRSDSNDADHSRMRRLLSHAFSDAALREQEPTMTKYFDLLVTGLSRKCDAGESVDMCKWYNYLTFDIIGDLCFNESFGALETGEYHVWMNNLFQGIKFARFLRIAVTYKPLMLVLKLWTKLNPKIAEARVQHEQFTKLKTAKRMDSPTNHKDFMTYVSILSVLGLPFVLYHVNSPHMLTASNRFFDTTTSVACRVVKSWRPLAF